MNTAPVESRTPPVPSGVTDSVVTTAPAFHQTVVTKKLNLQLAAQVLTEVCAIAGLTVLTALGKVDPAVTVPLLGGSLAAKVGSGLLLTSKE